MSDLLKQYGRGRRRDPLQFNATPWEATAALLRAEGDVISRVATEAFHEKRPAIWECCCGKGDMARVLEHTGLGVIATDIEDRGYGEPGVDALAVEKAPADIWITNPPYDDFPDLLIRHAAELGVSYLALLLKADFFHAVDKAGRDRLFREFTPSRIYPLGWRLDWTGAGAPVMNCSWFIWIKPGDADFGRRTGGTGYACYMPPLPRPRPARIFASACKGGVR